MMDNFAKFMCGILLAAVTSRIVMATWPRSALSRKHFPCGMCSAAAVQLGSARTARTDSKARWNQPDR